MKRQRALAITAASAIATTFALAFTSSAASADPLELKADEARSDLLGTIDPAMVEEMSKTFDLTATEVYDRLAVEAVASDLLEEVPAEFSGSYAGLWVSEDAEEIMVATTSAADADELETEGATPSWSRTTSPSSRPSPEPSTRSREPRSTATTSTSSPTAS
ncbi:hypothetical protein GCM10029992_24170 [Glycomyces albus]